jgi:hypothetical protein
MIVQVESHVAWEAHACRVIVGVGIGEECSILNRNQSNDAKVGRVDDCLVNLQNTSARSKVVTQPEDLGVRENVSCVRMGRERGRRWRRRNITLKKMSSGGLFKSNGETEEDDGPLAAAERLLPIVEAPGPGVLAMKNNECIAVRDAVFEVKRAKQQQQQTWMTTSALHPVGVALPGP